MTTKYSYLRKRSRTVNGYPVYYVSCPHCKALHEGQFIHAGWTGPVRYCSSCANLKLSSNSSGVGPHVCACGGVFSSFSLRCPTCQRIIRDRVKQLAVQYYAVDAARKNADVSDDEIDRWYRRLRRSRGCSRREFFIQVAKRLSLDRRGTKWVYSDPFKR